MIKPSKADYQNVAISKYFQIQFIAKIKFDIHHL